MATQYEPIVKDSTLNTTEQTPRNIADVLADETGDLVTQATAIVTKLQALINAVKPNASDIPLDPITGMSATNVQSGISELKGTLDDLDGLKTVTNLNTITTSGVCKYDGSSTGAPTANGGVVSTIYNSSSNQGIQTAQANNQSYTSFRRRNANGWGEWDKLVLQTDLDNKYSLALENVSGNNGILNAMLSAPLGFTFISAQNASDNPQQGTICMCIIQKIRSDSLYTYVYCFVGSYLYKATTGGTIPSSLTWTKLL